MKFEEYLEGLRGKSVAVIGLGVSNRPLMELLLSHGAHVIACDKKTELGEYGESLKQRGCTLKLGEDYLTGIHADVIFRTPGLRPDAPGIAQAVAEGAVLTSEMEAFFDVCPCEEIAVTGSDGKTTTTTIIARLLEAAGRTVHLGGNIGHPLLSETPTIAPEDLAVLELSSSHRGHHQSLSQPPGRPQGLRGVYCCKGKYLYTSDRPGYCHLQCRQRRYHGLRRQGQGPGAPVLPAAGGGGRRVPPGHIHRLSEY